MAPAANAPHPQHPPQRAEALPLIMANAAIAQMAIAPLRDILFIIILM
jgi:hypothetical protein